MPSIRVNGLDHYYEQAGEGPALVLVHGAFVDSRLWDPQVERFAAHYQVLRYDLRGHGRTGPSALSPYAIDTFAGDLAGLLDALDIQSPVLCGLSLGGMIAQAFAVRHPGRLRALSVFDGTRSKLFPEVPAAREEGYSFGVSAWSGFYAPKGVPAAVRGALVDALHTAFNSPEFQKVCEERGMDAVFLDSPEFRAFANEQAGFFETAIPVLLGGSER